MHVTLGIIGTVLFLSLSSYCIATSQLSDSTVSSVEVDNSNQLVETLSSAA